MRLNAQPPAQEGGSLFSSLRQEWSRLVSHAVFPSASPDAVASLADATSLIVLGLFLQSLRCR